jgi:oligosaccharyl transferase (archaeosortase A-associated)
VKKSDLLFLGVILFVAAALRVWAPWGDVFRGGRVNFLETDAWYHVRLAEHQVRNFPRHLTVDPYAAAGGQYVAVAPLFDTIVATTVFVTRGPNAPTAYIERVAALAPPIMGVLAVLAVWALATLAFDRRAGFLAGFLAAILPGHFLDRTLVGFVDHHALEVLLSFATLAAFVWALRSPEPGARSPAAAAGCLLGLYLLAWSSGAFFVTIIAAWIALAPFVGQPRAAIASARTAAIAAAIALMIVLLFQSPSLFRYQTQIVSLAGLLIVSIAVMQLAERMAVAAGIVAALVAVMVIGGMVLAPELFRQVTNDLGRFRPDPTRMAVLEARPLFLYTGNWEWLQPWTFFRSGFYVGVAALVALAASLFRSRRLDHLVIVVFTASVLIATIGQNRFAYYLVPATAVAAAWLSICVLDWARAGRTLIPFQREVSVMLVAGIVVAPNLVPAAITTTRTGGMPEYWAQAMNWLRTSTPPPFESESLFDARYRDPIPAPAYTVMNWWDQGYWIVQAARRVPVSNPTQVKAPNAASFYTATDEAEALRVLSAEQARYVLLDWELPFRDAAGGALAGRFQNLADWAGIPTSRFYSLCYTRGAADWQPVWLFNEAYYQTMTYRLMVLGGQSASPANNTYVVKVTNLTDVTGRRFCALEERQVYETAAAAAAAASQKGAGYRVVGLNPWRTAFPLDAISGLRVAKDIRQPQQPPTEVPMVRIFEVIQRGER